MTPGPESGARGRARLSRALFMITLLVPLAGHTAGLFAPGHGVRAMGRGGAFTAGGDDPGGIWYNPATLGSTRGLQLLLDASLVLMHVDFQRIDSGGNQLPAVTNQESPLPIPTLAASLSLGRRLWLGASLSAPYGHLPVYPRPGYGPCDAAGGPCIDTAHRDAPQRYSLVSMEGSVFVRLELAAAYRLLDSLVIGLSLQNMFVRFSTLSAVSGYDGAIGGGPEDPEHDALARTTLLSLFNPSAQLGLLYRPHPQIAIGLAFQLPFWVGGEAKIAAQLPVSPLFDAATLEGDRADVSFTLPFTLRAGVEVQALPSLRVELGLDWERWSMLQAIKVQPLAMAVLNLPSIDRFEVPAVSVALRLRDSVTLRLGAEYSAPLGILVRWGVILERGAVEEQYASVMLPDNDKLLLTVGLGYRLWDRYQIDLFYARDIRPSRDLPYTESAARQVNPIAPERAVGVGGGHTGVAADLVGLGVQARFR